MNTQPPTGEGPPAGLHPDSRAGYPVAGLRSGLDRVAVPAGPVQRGVRQLVHPGRDTGAIVLDTLP